MSEFRMPSLGTDMEAGTLVEWMKRPGERVERGEAIAAVETQKGAIEIEAFESGVLERILVAVGERVPVGTPLAIIRGGGAAVAETPAAPAGAPLPPRPPPSEPPVAVASAPPRPAAPPAPPRAPAAGAARRITPAAMRRAQELGVDLATVPLAADGVVGLREVEAANVAAHASSTVRPGRGEAKSKDAPAASPKPGLDPAEMRKAIAAAMARSWREIPHYFVSSALDVSPLLAWLAHTNAERPVPERLHYAVPLIKAIALALKATPTLNGCHDERGFTPAEHVHLGIAVAMRGGGLIAPALFDADTLALPELMARLADLVARVRGGRLRSSEMTAATATLTNLGEHTADVVHPVIFHPQVAIVGCGQISERAWAHADALSVRRVMTVTVGGDHRVSDGRAAAQFLSRLGELLQHPEQL